MIERFNFYDLYGYLIPGLALIAVLWFPFWYVGGQGLPKEWTSALGILVLGYIAGHLLQIFARLGIPHLAPGGTLARPSDYLLDETDTAISTEVKRRLVDIINEKFKIDVLDSQPGQRARRQDAFFLCRRALVEQGASSYAEQFQGLYAMMRGLAAASFVSACYSLAWAAGLWGSTVLEGILLFVIFGALLALVLFVKIQDDKWAWIFAVGAIASLGCVFSGRYPIPDALRWQTVIALVAFSLASWIAMKCFASSFAFFGREFASTVYRDFYASAQMGRRALSVPRRRRRSTRRDLDADDTPIL